MIFLALLILPLSAVPSMTRNLSNDVIPLHYDLFVNTEPGNFNGNVVIHLETTSPVKSFKINSKDLILNNLKVVFKETSIPCCLTIEDSDFVLLSLESEVNGKFTLGISYTGNYSDCLAGFYKSEYNGNTLYSTKFESTDARRAFPCFDQPDMKATFDISVKVPAGLIAISNSSVKTVNDDIYVFNTTPPMSTYLVAFVIGKLDFLSDEKSLPFPVRIYADPSDIKWGYFALEIAVKCLMFFQEYFGIKYPLPKLDLVAIPSFASGAMENWGIITFRKIALLFDKSTNSIQSKRMIAMVICHELAHMWFGNLVTMKWWDDLWLNESFASWAAYLALSQPTLQLSLPNNAWTNFINDEILDGMSIDSMESTHQIATKVDDPTKTGQVYDEIVYSKGASVIRMIENWIGPNIFQFGLAHYLKKHRYGNATSQDLWNSLSYVYRLSNPNDKTDLVSVINPWIQQPGFPSLIVEDLGDKIRLSQQRLTIGFVTEEKSHWPIPIKILWIGDSPVCTKHLLVKDSIELEKLSGIYKVNDEFAGFYQVSYPKLHVKSLLQHDLTPSNKANLFSDLFSSVLANRTNLQDVFDLLELLARESNYDVLLIVINNLKFFKKIFFYDLNKVRFLDSKMAAIVKGRFEKINLSVEFTDVNTASVNSLIVSTAVDCGYQPAITRLQSCSRESLNPEYTRSYLIANIDKNFKSTYNSYITSGNPAEKMHALFAIGRTAIEENFNWILHNFTDIAEQDMWIFFRSLSMNLVFREKTVKFLIKNFDQIKNHCKNPQILRRCCTCTLSGYFNPNKDDGEVTRFLSSFSDDLDMLSALNEIRDYTNVTKELYQRYSSVIFE